MGLDYLHWDHMENHSFTTLKNSASRKTLSLPYQKAIFKKL